MRERRDRLIAAGAALVVVVLAGLVVTTMLQARRNGRDALAKLQQAQIGQLAASMDTRVKTALGSLAPALSARPWHLTPRDPTDSARVAALFATGSPRAGGYVVDSGGAVTAGYLLQGDVVGTHVDRPGLERVRAPGGTPTILPVASSLTTASRSIGLAFPVTTASGATGAFVLESEVAVDSDFNLEVRSLGRGNTGEFSFVDDRGVVLASSNRDRLGNTMPALPALADNRAGFHRGGGKVAAIADVPSAGWKAIFVQDASEFEGGLTGPLRSALLLLVLAALAAAGMVFVALLRRLRAARIEQQRLAELNASQEEFISIVSHELRTPVTGLAGFLQTTLDHWDQMPDAERRGAIARAFGNARRLRSLTSDVLDTARIEAGELLYSFEVLDLRREVAAATEAMQTTHPDRTITLVAPDAPVLAQADGERIQQVVTNLLDNALKNSPATTTVEVQVTLDDGKAAVAVSDHGPGMSKDELEHVFEKFVRGRSTVKGSGLGLYISRRILDAHGGRIWATSLEGTGATVTFALPLAQAPAEPVVG